MIMKNLLPYMEIIYRDTVGFPDQKSISKELISGLDFDEDWAWSAAGLIVYYRKKEDKESFMRILNNGVRIKLSEDLGEVVKDHIEKYGVVDENDERNEILLKIDVFTTNEMFLK